MSFQIKDFNSIVAGMLNHARSVTTEVTDFLPGSVVRTLMEAPAVEMEELYLQYFLGLRDAIPVATFLSFGFTKLPAMRALGFVSISKSPAPSADIEIPAGATFTTIDGRTYASTADVTWLHGTNVVRVPVAAPAAGLIGNAAAGIIVSSSLFDDTFEVSNPAITTGRDAESDAEQEARFADFISSLSRGTVTACLFAAKSATVLDADGNVYEYVSRLGYSEDPGIVSIYLYSNAGIPSDELLADAQSRLDGKRDPVTNVATPGYRSAGVEVDALAMVERAVPLSISVQMFPGFTLTTEVEQALGDIFTTAITGIQPGETMPLGTLTELLIAVPGVRTIVPNTNSNINCSVSEALVAGAFNVSPL